ncbi:hypothetical protein [Dongia sp.]|uniref:hypothetical protein n=1 Tax=Dongia sp. TaxID=1977262 RepID=UPI0037509E7A
MDERRVQVMDVSWQSPEKGYHCFEALVDGQAAVVHVAEDIAFDFLGGWTPDTAKCLDILRLHRADLAKALERKLPRILRCTGQTALLLTWEDSPTSPLVERDHGDRKPQPAYA